jgi:hypothetical protein
MVLQKDFAIEKKHLRRNVTDGPSDLKAKSSATSGIVV